MAEIGKNIRSQQSTQDPTAGQQPGSPTARPPHAQSSISQQGVFVKVGNQPDASAMQPAQQRMVINKRELESFLQRHPEVLRAMADEMQQASEASSEVPRATPANQPAPLFRKQAGNAAPAQPVPQSVNPAPQRVQMPRRPLQNSMQRLVTIPNKTPPSSPFGLGEMAQAARVDITSLDTHSELYQSDFKIAPVQRAIQSYSQASSSYRHQASIEPVRLAKDAERKNNPDVQRRTQSVQKLKNALSSALSEIGSDPAYAQRTTSPTGAQRASRGESPESIEQRKADILPFAEQYARSLGYAPEKGDTEKILQDTVNFYSRSNGLASTLKSLVNSLQE